MQNLSQNYSAGTPQQKGVGNNTQLKEEYKGIQTLVLALRARPRQHSKMFEYRQKNKQLKRFYQNKIKYVHRKAHQNI